MAKHPNQGGGSNRQGPKVTKQSAARGPIIGKMTSVTGTTRPWSPGTGTSSGAGRNMSGSNWKKAPPHAGKNRGKSSKEWLD
jgi:hypothetical protein